MKSFKYLFIIMFATAALVGCKKKAADNAGDDTKKEVSEGIDFDAMAKEMCDCTTDLASVVDKMETLADDTEALTGLTADMAPKTQKMIECMSTLQANYPGVEGDVAQEAKVEAAMAKNCPTYAKVMKVIGGE